MLAFIMDLSIVYGLAFISFNILQLIHVYVPIAILILVISLLYFPIITIRLKRTIGKDLCGLIIENNSRLNSSKSLLLRELAYKQLFYILPLYLIIKLFKLSWLSPYFEIFYCSVLSLILFTLFLFRKRTYYDKWARTEIIKQQKNDITYSKKSISLLVGIALVTLSIRMIYYVSSGSFNDPFIPNHPKKTLSSYVSFLEKQQDAKDYVIKLFEMNDFVILCERDHPEMTQYDFLIDLISDDRFIKNVGNVFTEVGTRTQQANLDTLMNLDSLTNDEIDNRLCNILQDYSHFPIWEYTNYYDYLKTLYNLNQTLNKDTRISNFFTDVDWNWDEIRDKSDYDRMRQRILTRDKKMADLIITKYENILKSDQKRKKCLIVMNYRHAFGPTNIKLGDTSCATFIMKRYPDKAVNILINTVRVSLGMSKPEYQKLIPVQKSPIKSGIWDKSFEENGNKSLGFNFKGSPFGEDDFDLFFSPNGKLLKYKDVFTGLIFYTPIQLHYNSLGFKNIIANGFDKEILRRATITSDNTMDFDNNLKYVKEKVNRLMKQEITIIKKPYQIYESVMNLILGTTLLCLGITSGLICFLMKNKITKA